MRVLFVHRDADEIDSCLQELKGAGFAVQADIVLTLGQCIEQLRKEPFDLIVAEYPNPNWNGSQLLHELRRLLESVALIFVTGSLRSESRAALSANGACDFVETEHLEHLPGAVRLALKKKKLREEPEQAASCKNYREVLGNTIGRRDG